MLINMSYMWENFNIKTFPAETIVYRDGLFCPELSTLKNTDIDKNYNLPVHIIYVGEITDKNELDVNISAQNQKVFLSMKIKNKKPAFLNIFIKNTGKKSDFRAHIMLENNNDLIFNCTSEHSESETTGLIKVKLLAGKESKSKLSGTAIINKNCLKTQSDISFSAIADKSARIEFMPAQKISALPEKADHSASIYKPTDFQIEYLRESGLSSIEIENVMKEAFFNDMNLF